VVADRLLAMGAEVRAADPHVVEGHVNPAIVRVDCTPEEVRSADLVLLVTDHEEFDYDMVLREAAAVFDTRRRLDPAPNVEQL
jgi:UDP-N-acetyl-D-glucosamine dehydrogenase